MYIGPESFRIGPLHDPVTWYKIIYTGEQVAQWDFQNKGRCIVLEVPPCSPLYIHSSHFSYAIIFSLRESSTLARNKQSVVIGTFIDSSVNCYVKYGHLNFDTSRIYS